MIDEFSEKSLMLMQLHYSRLSEKGRRQYAALESLKLIMSSSGNIINESEFGRFATGESKFISLDSNTALGLYFFKIFFKDGDQHHVELKKIVIN